VPKTNTSMPNNRPSRPATWPRSSPWQAVT
jgi:hypothetical protein